MKGIRVSEDGDASLEDLTNSVAQSIEDNDAFVDPEGIKSSNKKVWSYILNYLCLVFESHLN
jgi:DNA helicase INO80